MKICKKKWGWEVILVSTELYSCKLMVIKGGYQCSVHYHKLKTEDFLLLIGNVKIEDVFTSNRIEDWSISLLPLVPYHIPVRKKHRFKQKGPCRSCYE